MCGGYTITNMPNIRSLSGGLLLTGNFRYMYNAICRYVAGAIEGGVVFNTLINKNNIQAIKTEKLHPGMEVLKTN